jgi:SAM-dependent methyltransferase/FKBP-type peptidyl-prolyl cis-trans isomerase 2
MELTTPLYDEAATPRPNGRDTQRQPMERTSPHAMAALRLDLHWACEAARHTDTLLAAKINLWRDILPPELEQEIMGQTVGHRASHRFAPGELATPRREEQLLRLRNAQFDRRFTGRGYVQPRAGRFYPRGMLDGVEGVFRADRQPFRVAEANGESLLADLNHPLADRPLRLDCTIEEIWAQGDQRGGRCNEVADLVTAGGPGMQARWRGLPTDFWSDGPFHRQDPRPDAGFYAGPRLVDHMDGTAIAQVSALYARLIPAGSRVLDLMASWHSHLPPGLEPASVAGLGMNRDELDANPILTERVVQDLNQIPALPFPDAAFDAVVCTVSVEYLTQPFAVFREVARVLAPRGRFIVTFSNRWFPPKVIRLWEGIHEFERPGLVLEYFLESGLFGDLQTWSMRGLPRPADDKYADRLLHSDPVYAVWGEATRS